MAKQQSGAQFLPGHLRDGQRLLLKDGSIVTVLNDWPEAGIAMWRCADGTEKVGYPGQLTQQVIRIVN